MKTETKANPLAGLTADQIEQYLKEIREQEREEREAKKANYEELRSSTVDSLVAKASTISGLVKDFSAEVFNELGALHEVLKEYSQRYEKGKGNFTVSNADNSMRIKFRANKSGYFDERSNQAEQHIKDFITNKFYGDADTKELISSLLERRKGHLDINLVQRLYKFEDRWDDHNWREGIRLLKESWTDSKTRYYAQFEVFMNDTWKPIIIDFATLCNQN